MATRRKLKVFRTAIGFHDAYVAAPSRKAALAAWGAHGDWFGQGIAEEVHDPTVMKAALTRPGEVVRASRGSVAEQLAAAVTDPAAKRQKAESAENTEARHPPARAPRNRAASSEPDRGAPARMKAKRPSRTAVDRAERAVAQAEARHEASAAAINAEQSMLVDRRRELERKYLSERVRLDATVDRSRQAYQAAIERWAGGD